jgi:DNA-binding transcriptional ArsR family regulator
MSRRRTKPRLTNALPVAVVVLGAALTAARKRRAARLARHNFTDRVTAGSQAPEPRLPTPVDAGSAPAPSGLSLVVTDDETSPSVPDERAPALTAPAAGRDRRGMTTANVLAALAKGGNMTASEVAQATGMGRATISSTLSRLAKSGAVTKAERGYRLPDGASNSKPTPKKRTAKKSAPKTSRPPARPTVASASSRTAPGATKAKVLAALSTDVGATAGDVATATGLGRGTVSTTLSKLSKNGEIIKADRGYRLPS